MADRLTGKRCEPCSGDTPALTAEEAFRLHEQVTEWDMTSGRKLVRTFELEDFLDAIDFVNAVADVAEEEGHHPVITIDYDDVTFTVWTHAIGDLSENDFILAAKIDELYAGGTEEE
ncbi:MAG TPA: 4a-hydroxytetrahydrobiopterin dehydratase [Gemmatimonadota bacterium]|nr:4a-hydroxytetrahydrobiopterin dehydratase [Gemmatimonadota bacterium]